MKSPNPLNTVPLPGCLLISLTGAASLLLSGCNRHIDPVISNTQQDIGHDHRHMHGEGHDHEHEHSDGYQGAHDHQHAHGHRHDEPLYGGKIFAIGHSHHHDDEKHYHAEVMPVEDGRLVFHLLTETSDLELVAFPIESTEMVAYLQQTDGLSPMASEILFKPACSKGSCAEFVCELSDALLEGNQWTCVVPKIVLGGERFSFSFSASRNPASGEAPAVDADVPRQPRSGLDGDSNGGDSSDKGPDAP